MKGREDAGDGEKSVAEGNEVVGEEGMGVGVGCLSGNA